MKAKNASFLRFEDWISSKAHLSKDWMTVARADHLSGRTLFKTIVRAYVEKRNNPYAYVYCLKNPDVIYTYLGNPR